MGRVYAGWGLSQAFYRGEIWRQIGFSSLQDFLIDSFPPPRRQTADPVDLGPSRRTPAAKIAQPRR